MRCTISGRMPGSSTSVCGSNMSPVATSTGSSLHSFSAAWIPASSLSASPGRSPSLDKPFSPSLNVLANPASSLGLRALSPLPMALPRTPVPTPMSAPSVRMPASLSGSLNAPGSFNNVSNAENFAPSIAILPAAATPRISFNAFSARSIPRMTSITPHHRTERGAFLLDPADQRHHLQRSLTGREVIQRLRTRPQRVRHVVRFYGRSSTAREEPRPRCRRTCG